MLENISFSFWLYFWRDFVHLHARRRFPAFQTFKRFFEGTTQRTAAGQTFVSKEDIPACLVPRNALAN